MEKISDLRIHSFVVVCQSSGFILNFFLVVFLLDGQPIPLEREFLHPLFHFELCGRGSGRRGESAQVATTGRTPPGTPSVVGSGGKGQLSRWLFMAGDIRLSPFQIAAQEIPLQPTHIHHVIGRVVHRTAFTVEHACVISDIRHGFLEQPTLQHGPDLTINGEYSIDNRPLDKRLTT